MKDHENYNVSSELPEDLRKLICEFRAAIGKAPPSEKEIETTCAIWRHGGAMENTSALDFGKSQIADVELEKRIDAESETLEERRRRIENELGIPSGPSEMMGTLDIAMDELELLEAKTGIGMKEIHDLDSHVTQLMGLSYENPDDEKVKDAYERSTDELESTISKATEYLQSVLALQQKQSVKHPVDIPVKHIQQRARVASRTHHSATRPTPTGGGGGSGEGDDGDPDSSDSDPPAPGARAHHIPSVTFHFKRNKPRYFNRRFPLYSCRMAEGGRAA